MVSPLRRRERNGPPRPCRPSVRRRREPPNAGTRLTDGLGARAQCRVLQYPARGAFKFKHRVEIGAATACSLARERRGGQFPSLPAPKSNHKACREMPICVENYWAKCVSPTSVDVSAGYPQAHRSPKSPQGTILTRGSCTEYANAIAEAQPPNPCTKEAPARPAYYKNRIFDTRFPKIPESGAPNGNAGNATLHKLPKSHRM